MVLKYTLLLKKMRLVDDISLIKWLSSQILFDASSYNNYFCVRHLQSPEMSLLQKISITSLGRKPESSGPGGSGALGPR